MSSKTDNVKEYWDILSSGVSNEFKDHWVAPDGSSLDDSLFLEISDWLASYVDTSRSAMFNILEVGCGTGRILSEIAKKFDEGVYISGIDFSLPQIDAAKERLGGGADLYAMDIFEFTTHRNKKCGNYDLIFLHSVTQYFPDEEYFLAFLEAAYSLLNKNGSLVLLDCPIDWYSDLMRKVPTGILYNMKQLLKKLLKYERKVMTETLGGVSLSVPVFKGYWINPDQATCFAKGRFAKFSMEYQQFKHKPNGYKKFRPNFIFTLKN